MNMSFTSSSEAENAYFIIGKDTNKYDLIRFYFLFITYNFKRDRFLHNMKSYTFVHYVILIYDVS